MVDRTDDVFIIEARLCKRCGRLLTNSKAVKDGYGCVCKRKKELEERGEPQIDGQVFFFDEKEYGKE